MSIFRGVMPNDSLWENFISLEKIIFLLDEVILVMLENV